MNTLLKNTARLLSANVVAQIIGLVAYPILTRLYSPADFGLMNLFLSIGGVLTILATTDLQYAIVLPMEERTAQSLYKAAACVIGSLTVVLVLSILFSSSIAELANAPELGRVWHWMSAFVLLSGVWNLHNYWLIRNQQFGTIGFFRVAQSVVGTLAKLTFGLLGLLRGGLIEASVCGLAVALVGCLWLSRKQRVPLCGVCSPSRSEMKSAVSTYRKFIYFSLPRSLVNTISYSLPALMMAPIFGLTDLGYFSMAITFAFIPINLLSGSIHQVLYQHITERVNRSESIRPMLFSFVKKMFLGMAACLTVLYFLLPLLMDWLLGSGYALTGQYIRIMIPWLLMSVLVAPICFLCDVFQKQGTSLLFEISLLLMRILGIGWGVYTHRFIDAVIGYSIGSALVILAQLIWYGTLVTRYERTRP